MTVVNSRTPPSVNARDAARRGLPGIVEHGSARQGGVRPDVPGFGDAPRPREAGARDRQVPGLRPYT
ncbi:hypothetical protein GCM10019016_102910 [Streptomyces prasinosporus]|uniref:Uncharacterized protein n=1 Tax=Streptomyces prasinosporus TaxID=68256 RepID=A0ABP6TV39_9ACTN